jgi:hypothetical protein
MRRAPFLVTACFTALLAGCSPELGDAPFACSTDGACPEGYACQSAVCVKDGASLPASHPRRATWINAGEMFWLAGASGAELIVNDGFTPGARGIYAITVAPDGAASAPRPLLPYGGEVPMASSVTELTDGRYGVVTLSFPDIESDDLTLTVRAIERAAPSGAAPSIETLYTDKEPYLGGSEPAYVSAIAGNGTLDLAWTRPSLGGRVEVIRLAREGAVWKPKAQVTQALPPEILPLSGDCALWKTGPDSVLLRVGFEQFAVAPVDLAAGTMAPFKLLDDMPIYGWADKVLLLRYGDFSVAAESYRVSYVLASLSVVTDPAPEVVVTDLESDDGGVLQEALEPYTAVPFKDGALFGPVSSDPAFPALSVASRSPTQKLTPIASVARQSSDRIYSARAFEAGGKVYFAWTEFHESQMDLWIAVADPSAGLALEGALIRPPQRAASFSNAPPPARIERRAAWRRP